MILEGISSINQESSIRNLAENCHGDWDTPLQAETPLQTETTWYCPILQNRLPVLQNKYSENRAQRAYNLLFRNLSSESIHSIIQIPSNSSCSSLAWAAERYRRFSLKFPPASSWRIELQKPSNHWHQIISSGMPSKSSETLSFRSKTYREDGNHIKACLVGCRWCRVFKFLFIICGYITTAIIWNDRRGNRRGN